MRRRIMSVASVLSLLLCVGTAVLWLIGDITGLSITWIRMDSSTAFQTRYAASVSGGGFAFETSADLPDPSGLGWYFGHDFNDYPDPDHTWRIYVRENLFRLVFPCWSVLLLSLLLPIWWTIRARARPAKNRSTCSTCGYTLTGNTSGTCPECGAAIPTPINPPEPKSSRPA